MSEVLAVPVGTAPQLWRRIAFILGAMVGGAATGSVVAIVWRVAGVVVSDNVRIGSVASLLAASIVSAYAPRSRRWWPHRAAQVPIAWIRWQKPGCCAAAWGFLIGGGLWTHLISPLMYSVLFLSAAQDRPVLTILVVSTYALVRATTIVAAGHFTVDPVTSCGRSIGVGLSVPIARCVAPLGVVGLVAMLFIHSSG